MKSIIKNREKLTKVGYQKDNKIDSPLARKTKKTEKSKSY